VRRPVGQRHPHTIPPRPHTSVGSPPCRQRRREGAVRGDCSRTAACSRIRRGCSRDGCWAPHSRRVRRRAASKRNACRCRPRRTARVARGSRAAAKGRAHIEPRVRHGACEGCWRGHERAPRDGSAHEALRRAHGSSWRRVPRSEEAGRRRAGRTCRPMEVEPTVRPTTRCFRQARNAPRYP
jgi:hypothetical protein